MAAQKSSKHTASYTRPLSSRQINLFAGIVGMLIIIVGLAYAGYAYQRYTAKREAFYQLQWSLEQKQQAYKNLEQLIQKYAEEQRHFEEFLFTDRDVATFLDEFSQFAEEAKIEIARIRSQKQRPVPEAAVSQQVSAPARQRLDRRKEEGPTGLLVLPMQVGIRGDFLSTINFLIKLERYRQLLTVSDVKIAISREGYPLLDTDFLLRLYSISNVELQITQ